MVMPVTIKQLNEAKRLVEAITNLENLIAHFSGKSRDYVTHIHFDHLGGTGLAEDFQIKCEHIIDMLGAQCDGYIVRLEELGFAVDE